jgi:hypothetical protein
VRAKYVTCSSGGYRPRNPTCPDVRRIENMMTQRMNEERVDE